MQPEVAQNIERCRSARPLVRFLQQPGAYPDTTTRVELRETHMNWVFLLDEHVYKLKKPVRYWFLDFSTLEKRRQDCERELQLNRRISPDVYLETVPVTRKSAGGYELDGEGDTIDWLVRMRRLPEHRMLDRLVERDELGDSELAQVSELLAYFYQSAAPSELSPDGYRSMLRESIDLNESLLTQQRYGCDAAEVSDIAQSLRQTLADDTARFDRRVRAGRVIEAHGDLRPEHICFEDDGPKIIDCLEFNRELRLLDSLSELVYLALETDRLGVGWAGRAIVRNTCEAMGEAVDEQLVAFYHSYHALIRARVAALHVDDPLLDSDDRWKRKANDYLHHASGSVSGRRA